MGEHLETTFGQVVGIVKEIVDNPFVFGSLQKRFILFSLSMLSSCMMLFQSFTNTMERYRMCSIELSSIKSYSSRVLK